MISKSFDIISLTETWLSNGIFDNESYPVIIPYFVKIVPLVVAVC